MAELRRKHRIRAVLRGNWADPPVQLADRLAIVRGPDNQVMIEASDDLSPLLAWLSTLPLAEVRIEPVGLQEIYDRIYPAAAA
jgi:ABC-2 type transport system ATP-binding protein